MTDAEKESILDEIVRLGQRVFVEPSDVRASDLARRLGITEVMAKRDLNDLVKSGRASTRLAYDTEGGRQVRVWRLIT